MAVKGLMVEFPSVFKVWGSCQKCFDNGSFRCYITKLQVKFLEDTICHVLYVKLPLTGHISLKQKNPPTCCRFINARRRILQPMLDASNPDGPKAKKSKIQRFPAQRFWPESLVPNQFSSVPIAPASMTVLPAGMQVQTVQHVGGTTVAVPTTIAIPSTITVPTSLIQTMPNSVAMQHQPVPGTNMVVVTLPPNASQVTTLSEPENNVVVSSRSTMITSTATSQADSACLTSGSMSPMLVHVCQESPVPTMSQNGSVRSSDGNLHLVGSSSHMATTVMQEGISTVEGLQLDSGAVHTGLVNQEHCLFILGWKIIVQRETSCTFWFLYSFQVFWIIHYSFFSLYSTLINSTKF